MGTLIDFIVATPLSLSLCEECANEILIVKQDNPDDYKYQNADDIGRNFGGCS